MAGIPDSQVAKWIGFISGVVGLAGLVVPALKGVVSANFVVLALVIGIVAAASRLYVKRNVTDISIAKWSLKITLLFVFFFAWLALVSLGNPELIKGYIFLNKIHRYIIDYFEIYSLLSCAVIAVLAYLVVDIAFSLIRSFFT
ncbi:hypothetical protein [Paracoccus sp. (in: a-proteobacteria)]|uniref:hypothetical protein n=1 Tax=Paracoccus sp. TaxID=267 RepID=UPI002588F04F|nr:hypothetical protein [Paracoccus sp. (in: a-proteobacteria)]